MKRNLFLLLFGFALTLVSCSCSLAEDGPTFEDEIIVVDPVDTEAAMVVSNIESLNMEAEVFLIECSTVDCFASVDEISHNSAIDIDAELYPVKYLTKNNRPDLERHGRFKVLFEQADKEFDLKYGIFLSRWKDHWPLE